jgi:hypothetical protein
MLSTVKIKSICRNLLLILTLSVFFSCQKDISIEDGGAVVTPPDLSTKINSSVSGFVTDENNAPVKNAAVQFGSSTITTDKYGYFEAKNVQVVKEAAVVTVSKPGYFKGIKTYMAKAGKSSFFRIKLIPKTTVGTINASTGGTVTLTSGLSVKLNAGTVVNAATNLPYTGAVNVIAFWINPEAPDFKNIMPGDLRGIDKNGSLKLMRTYGMAAVELTGSSGELLQITNGQKATLTLPIPASMVANAPASIPLSYFDEATGLGKEQGTAVKTGNTYVAEVSHFSWWWVTLPGPYVQFDCTVKDGAGNPLPNIVIAFSFNLNGSWLIAMGETDGNGYVSGPIPANTAQVFNIYSSNIYCSAPVVYTQNVTTTNQNVSLGDIVINGYNSIASVTGKIVDCNNVADPNTCVYIRDGYLYYRFIPNSQGIFNFSTLICSSPATITAIAQNLTTLQYGNEQPFVITTGNTNIGNISACGNSPLEFVHFTVDGNNYDFDPPSAYFGNYIWPAGIITNYASTTIGNYAGFDFTEQGIGVNSIQELQVAKVSQLQDSMVATHPCPVNITEYGATGQYMSGNFSGIFQSYFHPPLTYNVSCTFRVKRTF